MAARPNRRFTIPQIRRRLKAIILELAAIGGGYHLERSELRRRVLALQAVVQETLDRWPQA